MRSVKDTNKRNLYDVKPRNFYGNCIRVNIIGSKTQLIPAMLKSMALPEITTTLQIVNIIPAKRNANNGRSHVCSIHLTKEATHTTQARRCLEVYVDSDSDLHDPNFQYLPSADMFMKCFRIGNEGRSHLGEARRR